MTTTNVDQSGAPPGRGQALIPKTPGAIVKAIVIAVMVIFLLIFVGPTTVGSTLLKIVAAVGITVVLFVGSNLLFNTAYTRWSQFATASGFVVGCLVFFVLGGNRALRDFGPGPWLWALVGGCALGAVMFALTMPDTTLRLPIAAGGLGGVGVLIAVAVSDSRQPALDWTKLLICTGIGLAIAVGRRMLSGNTDQVRLLQSALTGAGVGWLIGAWGGATFQTAVDEVTSGGGNLVEAVVATAIPLAAIGLAIGLRQSPTAIRKREIEQASRAWIFVTPALLFIVGGLLAPLVRTVVLSFKNKEGSANVGFKNYFDVITSKTFFDKTGWIFSNVLGSRLLWIAVAFAAVGIVVGVLNGRKVRRPFEGSPGSSIALLVGFFFLACLVLGTLRGSIINNLWWVIVVTLLATALGLAVAVLADRAKGENIAKSLIFLPMAISFVGAGVIWTLVFKPRNIKEAQSGVLDAIWVGLGELSRSDWQKWVVFLFVAAVVAGLLYLAYTGIREGQQTRVGFSVGLAVLLAVLAILLVGPGLGFEQVADPSAQGQLPPIPDYVRDVPYNNMWLMVVLIWIQTGFGMVIFSSAIKAVPTEYLEAASIDGATTSQTFWRVTLPQLLPTVGVVVTTLIVSVMKVYDVIVVMTGGQNSTQVIAFQMIEQVNFGNNGLASTFATLLFVAILPVMVYNIRNMQKAK